MSDELIAALLRAVEAAPGDAALRLHLAEQLVRVGNTNDAMLHVAAVLQADPNHAAARGLMGQLLAPPGTDTVQLASSQSAPAQPAPSPAPPLSPPSIATPTEPPKATSLGFDWSRAEQQFSDGPDPMFTAEQPDAHEDGYAYAHADADDPARPEEVWEVEKSTVTLRDVGGMQDVKDRLEISFLGPLRNPKLRAMYGKSLRGGLLLYGPPGVGKTYIAKAVAGEMDAGFINVTLSDVLDMYIGQSEGNLHALFDLARRNAPAVLFFDEVDAIGQRRTRSSMGAMRGVVNQFLQELDGVGADNEGVYVMGATNAPWDLDPALRRPGRFDRTILVLPPDAAARHDILKNYLRRRPIEGIDLARLVKATEGLTGADLSHLVDTAAERAMMDSMRSGTVRMIGMGDLEGALREVRPSTGPWFDSARNVVLYGDPSGEYEQLRSFMKMKKLL